ncbi:hypothetical protein CHARACLAT_033490 [Characodon lateralis]|uniref:Uncharacterized protein n=1 Tax=Characodon lateralis TaxID=208331 RepID=A0ABU7EGG5_9TELE|nr:hypothetical protein [Characodon lateralis]
MQVGHGPFAAFTVASCVVDFTSSQLGSVMRSSCKLLKSDQGLNSPSFYLLQILLINVFLRPSGVSAFVDCDAVFALLCVITGLHLFCSPISVLQVIVVPGLSLPPEVDQGCNIGGLTSTLHSPLGPSAD